ncbi:MAG: FGGY family carbohydrate kinase [Albidovulum sp.]|nr:FGGY family carbohydrate kinase [Albidovulum sp.]
MAKSLFLGVDIGTFETKAALCDSVGKIVASAARKHEMTVPQPGWAEHRPIEDWWNGFVDVTSSVMAHPGARTGSVEAVAISAIGPCMLPVDGEGGPLSNAVLYGVDTRATKEIDLLADKIGEERIIEFNGNALNSQAVGPKILWLRINRPDLFEKAAKIVTSTTFLVQKLTGRCIIDHYTAANFTPIYNSLTRSWDDSLCDEIIELDRLPELGWSHEIAGTTTAEAANATGLPEGTPVTVGTIDAAAEAVSVGAMNPGDLMVMYGSTMFFVTVAGEWTPDGRLWYAPWLFPAQHASLAGLSTSGTLTHWFRDTFAKELDRDQAFPVLAEEASGSPPGARGLAVLPYFSGERTPLHDPEAKGCIFGLNLTHTRADLYRAVLEGIAYGARHVIETFEDIGAKPNRLLAVGGGTKNRIWLQSVSDISGFDQILREISIGASYGDAFLAAMAAGAAEQRDIDAWNPVSEKIIARTDAVYENGYSVFRDLYRNNKELMRRI